MLPPGKPSARRKAARLGASPSGEVDASREERQEPSHDASRSSAPRGKKPGQAADSRGQAWPALIARGAGYPHRRCGCAPSAGAAAPLLLLLLWALYLLLWPCHFVQLIRPLADDAGAGKGVLPFRCGASGTLSWPRLAPRRGLEGNDVVIEALKSLVRQEERQLGEERSEGGSLQEEASLENSKRPDGKGMPQDQEARNDCGSALSVGTCGQADVIILAQGSLGRRMEVLCLAVALAEAWSQASLHCLAANGTEAEARAEAGTGARVGTEAAQPCVRDQRMAPLLVRVLWGARASPGASEGNPSSSSGRGAGVEDGVLRHGVGPFFDYFRPLTMAPPSSRTSHSKEEGVSGRARGAVDMDVRDEAAPFLAPAHYLPMDLSAHLRMLRWASSPTKRTSGVQLPGAPAWPISGSVQDNHTAGATPRHRARSGGLGGATGEGEASGHQRRRSLLWATSGGSAWRTQGTPRARQGRNRQGRAPRRARGGGAGAEPASLQAWVSPELAGAVRRQLQKETGASLGPASAQCLGQLRPSPRVAEFMKWDLEGERGAQLEASTGLFLEGEVPDYREFQVRAPQGVPPCRPYCLINCTIFHVASLLLRNRSQTLTVAARWGSQAQAVASAFHPSAAPRLLLPTQHRVRRCSAQDPRLPVRRDTVSVREQERRKRTPPESLRSDPSGGSDSRTGAGSGVGRQLRPWELGLALGLPKKLQGQGWGARGQRSGAGLRGIRQGVLVQPRRLGAHRRRLLSGFVSHQWSAGLSSNVTGEAALAFSRAQVSQGRRRQAVEEGHVGLTAQTAQARRASPGGVLNPPLWSSAQAQAAAEAQAEAEAETRAGAEANSDAAPRRSSLSCSQLWLAELFLLSRARGLVHLAHHSLEARFIRAQAEARTGAARSQGGSAGDSTVPGYKASLGTASELRQQAQTVQPGPGELAGASKLSQDMSGPGLEPDLAGGHPGAMWEVGHARGHEEGGTESRGGSSSQLVGSLGYTMITQTQWARYMLVDEDLGFLFCHIPKVASSRWKEWLYALKNATAARHRHTPAGAASHPDVQGSEGHIAASEPGLHQGHTPGGPAAEGGEGEIPELQSWFSEAEAVRQLTRRDLLKVVFVRNPFSRLASAYFDKHIAGGEQKDRRYWNQLFFQSCLPVEPALPPGQRPRAPNAMGFTEFVDRLHCASQLYRTMEPHVAPQAQLCNLGAIQYDFVGRMERLQEDAAVVVRQLGERAGLRGVLAQRMEAEGREHFRSRSKHATHADSLLRHLYRDQKVIQAVAQLYSSDFVVPVNNISYSAFELPKV